jgi:FecR protein
MRFKVLVMMGVAIPALAAVPARPGTLNYVEGKVLVDDEVIAASSIGSAELQAGSVLRTESGKAEVLLTPGVFLRLGRDSQVRMLSAGLIDTRVAVDRGVALLDASEVHKENNIRIVGQNLITDVEKKGLYRFDAERSSVAVLDGKVEVRQGDDKVELKKSKEVVAGDAPLKAEKFDVDDAKESDELYQWSKLRSKYLSEASAVTARRIYNQQSGWYGSGWYWNPWMRTYSWLPARDPFFSPFGYGFYSPWSVYPRVYVVPRYRSWPRTGPRIRGGGGIHSGSPGRSSGRSSSSGRGRGR